LVVVIAAFLADSLPPYLTGDPGQSRVPATFGLHYPLPVAHVMFATVAMVSAVAQIWPGLRVRHPVLHRRTGRVYVAAAVPAITNRIWTTVLFIALQPLHDSVFHGDDVRFLWVAGIGAWLGGTIPLLIVQRWLGSKVVIPRSSIPPQMDTPRV
jgi:hypothetical protein